MINFSYLPSHLSVHPFIPLSVHPPFISYSWSCQGTGYKEIPLCLLPAPNKRWFFRKRKEKNYSGKACVNTKGTLIWLVRRYFLKSYVYNKSMAPTNEEPPGNLTCAVAVIPHLRCHPKSMSPQNHTSLLSGPAHLAGSHSSAPGGALLDAAYKVAHISPTHVFCLV